MIGALECSRISSESAVPSVSGSMMSRMIRSGFSFFSRSSCLASSRRRLPNTSKTTLSLSAAKRRRSPAFPSMATIRAAISSSFINFAKEDLKVPSSLMAMYARPFAPKPFAYSTRASIFFLGIWPWPSALMPRTEPPFSRAPLNTTNSQSFTTSETFFNSIPKRRSGLSEPKRSIASLHVMRWMGSCSS